MLNDTILVSVHMITYNHEDYLSRSIEGVLMQKTTFNIELVIGEDCSTDRTREICIKYANEYPEIIKLNLPEQNRGIFENYKSTYYKCKGKYIAFCEGDDYWIDPYKLQKQADFLEKNTDYGLVHTKYHIYYQKDDYMEHIEQSRHTGCVFDYLLQNNEIATLTTMARSELIDRAFKDNFFRNCFPALDYPLWLYISRISKIHYIDEVTGVYRKLSESASNSRCEMKMYKFLIGVTDIQVFYAEKYGKLSLILDEMIARKRRNLKYAYQNRNKEISIQAYNFIKKHKRLLIKDRMFYCCTNYPIFRFFAEPIIKIINK